MKNIICVAFVLALTVVTACNRGGGGEVALKDCKDQKMLKGTAGTQRYNTSAECVADREKQQKIAEADGIKKCNDYCADPDDKCKPMPVPKPQKTTPACKQQDDGKFQAEVETADFECICKK